MKLLPILLIVFFLSNCSFDNKSGIWKNENQFEVSENKDVFKEFQTLSASNNLFKEIVAIDKWNNRSKKTVSRGSIVR